jgi:hypothetical protein
MMFTIDLENKKILFHSEFTKQELEKVMDMLNISDGEEWKIDFYQPHTPPVPQQPNTYPWDTTTTNTSGTSRTNLNNIYRLTKNYEI